MPHVVLVEPFADRVDLTEGVRAELGAYFADVVPFSVRITHLTRLPDGSASLVLDSTAPLRNLAHGLTERFPELPTRRAGFADVPHVEVSAEPGDGLDRLEHDLAPWLPGVTLAREAALWWVGDESDDVRALARFPFGTTAA